MALRQSFCGDRIATLAGNAFLLAALCAIAAMALGIGGVAGPANVTEIAVACLLSALLFREIVSRRRTQRQTRDLRRQMREFEEKNRLLNLTEATAHVGHWRVDLSDNSIYWSDETFAIHGLEPGLPPDLERAIHFYHPDDRKTVEETLEVARTTGRPGKFRARLMRADGQIRHTESIAQVEFDAQGQPESLFGVFADRTREEEMQAELRDARDEARAMAQAKSTFLAKMSHEIRTPMNGVLGFAELLARSDLSTDQRRHIAMILEAGNSLQILLNDILDLSKIEAGKIEIDPVVTDLQHLISRAAQLVEPLARERCLSIEHWVDPDLPRYVMLDSLRLRQIVSNLVSNAIRFTEKGSVTLSAIEEDGRLIIRVRDTGVGIDPSLHEAIFDAFSQTGKGADKRCGGAGLGLAISRQLAELMSGSLHVCSAPGKGALFSLDLPLLAAEKMLPEAAPAVQAPQMSQLSGHRVLLAEDYDINRELICEMGRHIGVPFEVAEDGAEAVEMVTDAHRQGKGFAMVLMDLQMPRMNGLEATRKIREAGIGSDTLPIIALTANAFADDVTACLEAGMQEHLAKPITIDRLRGALTRWLPEAREAA